MLGFGLGLALGGASGSNHNGAQLYEGMLLANALSSFGGIFNVSSYDSGYSSRRSSSNIEDEIRYEVRRQVKRQLAAEARRKREAEVREEEYLLEQERLEGLRRRDAAEAAGTLPHLWTREGQKELYQEYLAQLADTRVDKWGLPALTPVPRQDQTPQPQRRADEAASAAAGKRVLWNYEQQSSRENPGKYSSFNYPAGPSAEQQRKRTQFR